MSQMQCMVDLQCCTSAFLFSFSSCQLRTPLHWTGLLPGYWWRAPGRKLANNMEAKVSAKDYLMPVGIRSARKGAAWLQQKPAALTCTADEQTDSTLSVNKSMAGIAGLGI